MRLRNTYVSMYSDVVMGFAVRVRSAGQKYGPTCHKRDRADVTEFLSPWCDCHRLGSTCTGVLALAHAAAQLPLSLQETVAARSN